LQTSVQDPVSPSQSHREARSPELLFLLPASSVLPKLTCLLQADHQFHAIFFLACAEELYPRKLNS